MYFIVKSILKDKIFYNLKLTPSLYRFQLCSYYVFQRVSDLWMTLYKHLHINVGPMGQFQTGSSQSDLQHQILTQFESRADKYSTENMKKIAGKLETPEPFNRNTNSSRKLGQRINCPKYFQTYTHISTRILLEFRRRNNYLKN